MRNTIEVVLPFINDKGNKKEHKFNIEFISNRINKDYASLQYKIKEISDKIIKLKDRFSDIGEYKSNLKTLFEKLNAEKKPSKEESEDILKGIKEYTEKVEKLSINSEKESKVVSEESNGFFKVRFDLIKKILIMNGYNNTKKEYLTFDFWDSNVNPGDIIRFLQECVLKDVSEKK